MSARILNREPTMAAVVVAASLDCAFVMLGHGRFAIVDKEDVERVNKRLWIVGGSHGGYVKQSGSERAYLHRFILGESDFPEIDHENRNGWDNRRLNLRFCTYSQNRGNVLPRSHNKASRFKGVRPSKSGKRFLARAVLDKKDIHLGSFLTEREAAQAYNSWALEAFGVFACLNVL